MDEKLLRELLVEAERHGGGFIGDIPRRRRQSLVNLQKFFEKVHG
jgi:hypothetical protein